MRGSRISFGVHRLNRIAFIAMIIAAEVLLFPISACAGQDLASDFRAQAAAKWEEYRPFGNRLQGLQSEQSIVDGKVVRRWRLGQKRNGTSRLDVTETTLLSDRERYDGEVNGFNDKYGFVLRRKSSAAPWLLDEVRLQDSVAEQPADTARQRSPLLLSVAGHDLAKLVKEQTFRLNRVEQIDRQGETLIRASFERVPSSDEIFPIQTGVVVLDPRRCWVLREFEIAGRRGTLHLSRKVEIDVVDSSSGFPIPKRVIEMNDYTLQDGTHDRAKLIRELDLTDPDPLPDQQEFTLTAFGLPEPPGVDWKKPTPWWLWGAGAGIASIIIAGLFGWLRARRRETVRA